MSPELLLLLDDVVVVAEGADALGQELLVGDVTDVEAGAFAGTHHHDLDDVAVAVLGLRRDLEHGLGALLGRHGEVGRADLGRGKVLVEQRRVARTRADGRDADAQAAAHLGERLGGAEQGRLGGVVEGRADGLAVAAHGGDEEQVALDLVLDPVAKGQLGQAQGPRRVDGERVPLAHGRVGVVLGHVRRARRDPEVGRRRLPDAGARAHELDPAKGLERKVPQLAQLGPVALVRLLVDGRGAALLLGRVRVRGQGGLGLGPQVDVGHHYAAASVEEDLDKGMVDT